MSTRSELLNRIGNSDTSPFLLCNLVARRARQLRNAQCTPSFSDLIDVALMEFLGGELKFEVNERGTQSGPDVKTARVLEGEERPSAATDSGPTHTGISGRAKALTVR
jgi:DNA-directed RNA polymerase subunit K/omega